MEITSKFRHNEHQQSPLNSPSSHTTCSTTTSTCSTPTPTPGPVPMTRSDPNSPYPTTFVTADTSSFKHVVQLLTGSSEPNPNPKPDPKHSSIIPPVKTSPPNKKQGFKLYERRHSLKHMISPLTSTIHAARHHHGPHSYSPRTTHNHSLHYHHLHNNTNVGPELLSPSLLDFPSLTLSPVTPLLQDPFNKSSSPSMNGGGSSSSEEDRAIADKGFYFHPSPPDSEPRLLPLFPLSSPRMSGP